MDPLTRVTAPTVDVLGELLNARDPVWGLKIIAATGRLPGTVYPILERLETLGWVQSSWEEASDRSGPRRRFYRLTTEGAVEAARTMRDFRARHAWLAG